MAVPTYRRPAQGRPRIGFQFDVPAEIELREGPAILCREQVEGRVVGELEISVFAASLVIDRDGALAAKASGEIAREHACTVAAVPVQLPGANGYRAELVRRAQLPYLSVIALVPHDGIEGGVLIKARAARPEWSAGDQILASLRIITRNGVSTQNEGDSNLPYLD